MNKLFSGSICLTDLNEQAKKGHSAFSKSVKNGKVYFNVLTWINEEKDKFGNSMSHQLNSSKDMRDKEGKFYIGNSKELETNKPVTPNDIDDDLSNVPERATETTAPVDNNPDDLPF